MIQQKRPQGMPIRPFIPLIFFVAVLLFVAYGQAQTLCPDCFKDQVPIGDNGVNSAGQNKVIIKIDDSWKTNGTIDHTIQLAVKSESSVNPDGGVDLWKKAIGLY